MLGLTTIIKRYMAWMVLPSAVLLAGAASAMVLDENCTVSVLNRSVQVNADGSWRIDNIPVQPGVFRVRATCLDEAGNTISGQTAFRELIPNGFVDFGNTALGVAAPVLDSMDLNAPVTTLTRRSQVAYIQATGNEPNGTQRDVTTLSHGTFWNSSNPDILSVDQNGMITAQSRGRAIITARNEGVVASIAFNILIPNDADGDGLTDEYEQLNGLNPNDAGDAAQDADGDGLTNLEEFQRGANPNIADSDGDGLFDGEEVNGQGTNPLQADSDGDGLLDGDELRIGSAPDNPDTDGDGIPDGSEVDFGLDPLTVNPTTTVTGRVVDNTGAAVAGAAATVLNRFTATTLSDGTFTLGSIPADRGDLSVFARIVQGQQVADGFSAATVPSGGGVTDVGVISLQSVIGRVTGTVFSPRGVVVPGARVSILSGADRRSVNADVNGVYQVDSMPPGVVTVFATDIATGLRGRSAARLSENGTAVIDITMTAAGTLQGTVSTVDDVPAGTNISVGLTGPSRLSTTTDLLSDYRFDFLPLGIYTVNAIDAEGNRGRTSAALTGTNQVIDADIRYLGRGSVDVVVEDATGVLVPDVNVALSSRSVFGGRTSSQTGALGAIRFDNIFVGDFDVAATDTASDLGGFAQGTVDAEGDLTSITITLEPAASLTGSVFEVDGVTPAAGVAVELSPSGRRMTTGTDGVYRFDALPLRSYIIDVSAGNGDRQRVVSNLQTAGETVTQNLVLNGLGRVNVTVVDGTGMPVPQAQVEITSQTPFGGTQRARSNIDGVAVFENVLAGAFTAAAMDPIDELGGSLASSVLVAETVDIILQLEDAAGIVGTVLAADGVTPVAGIRVRLDPIGRETVTGTDGRYRFDMIPVNRSPYTLTARDNRRALRASATGISLTREGEQLTRDLTLSGTGRVTGTVFNPDGSTAPTARITLNSQVNGMPNLFTISDSQGRYAIPANVPEGSFTVSAGVQRLRFGGNATGRVNFDGEQLVVNIQLEENQVPAATDTLTRLFDANGFDFAVQRDGSVRDGNTAVFRGNNGIDRGGMRLDIRANGNATPFTFVQGAFEDTGREMAIQGRAIAQLEVERKIFVPVRGYFARYLEVLTNPTASPVTVDVRVDTHYRFIQEIRNGFRFNEPPRVITTSNGNSLVQTGDNWAVIDDNRDLDPFRTINLPSVAQVFGGSGGRDAADLSEFEVDFSGSFGRLRLQWSNVTVNPGETVILMHFVAQQTERSAARQSAQRLVQLPPEALVGLSAAERGAIVNFAVPADGSSVLVPLPALDGQVTGTVLESDAVTLVPGTQVRLQSDYPLFRRVYTDTVGSDGLFDFTARFDNPTTNRALPRAGFSLAASHPISGAQAPAIAGDLTSTPVVTQDVVFAGSGVLQGTVRRPDGTVVSQGTVTVSANALLDPISVPIDVDGRYLVGGLPAGIYTISAVLPSAQGSGLSGTTSANVVIDQLTAADITLNPSGSVNGILRDGGGNAVVNGNVRLNTTGFTRATQTDTGGVYSFVDVSEGDYTVEATEPNTGVVSRAPVTVLADQVSVQDLNLVAVASVRVEATFADGGTPVNAPVQLRREGIDSVFRNVGNTDSNGVRLIGGIPAGNFTLRVLNPLNNSLLGSFSGVIAAHGEVIVAPVSVPVDLLPGIVLNTPVDGASFLDGTTVIFQASANDDFGINRVEFLIDGQVVGSDSNAPYSIGIPVSLPSSGSSRVLSVVAVDTVGQRTTSSGVTVQVLADTENPFVTLIQPSAGASFIEGSTINLLASANDNIAVDRVEFSAAGSVFATDATSNYAAFFPLPNDFADAGTTPLQLTATAFDRAGNSRAATVTVSVVPDQPPTVVLTQAPAGGSNHIEGSTVRFVANAGDDRGVIAAELLVNGQVVLTRSRAPYRFDFVLPAATDSNRSLSMQIRARDTRGQTATTTAVNLNVVDDAAPTVSLNAPLADVEIVEGAMFTVSANAGDDRGVAQVEFFIDGVSAGVDSNAPYQIQTPMTGGIDGSTAQIQAVATDSIGQTASASVNVIRRDDLIPPAVVITSPNDGAIVSVGASDVTIVVDTSSRTANTSGGDVDGDGIADNILKVEIFAARQLLNFFNTRTTQVSVVDFSGSAVLVQPLTSDFGLVNQALDTILASGSSGSTNLAAGVQTATDELVGIRARRDATPVQLLLSEGSSSFPDAEVTRAFEAGVIVNTFTVGSSANPALLQQIADGTGGVMTLVLDASDLVNSLPDIVRFGVNSLVVSANATDDSSLQGVTFRVTSADGGIDSSVSDDSEPYTGAFVLPVLANTTELTVTATARDFGGNEVAGTPITVTLLPAENTPQLVRLEPVSAAPGDVIDIVGKYLSPQISANVVSFNGVQAIISGATKTRLTVTVPVGARSGSLTVASDNLLSNPLDFLVDSDRDGLSDEQEVSLGTDPTRSDSDGDGLSDGEEINTVGSDPLLSDSDGDGLSDGDEVQGGLDPSDPGDAILDFDSDGLSNAQEIALGTDVNLPDTDFDGLTDGFEVNTQGTEPLLIDTDGGGRGDGDEVNTDATDPLDPADDILSIPLPSNLFDVDGFLWDIQRNASINNGTLDAYDGGLNLSVNGGAFANFTQAGLEEGGRELVIGSSSLSGLDVTRKIFVPVDDSFARFLEVLNNTGASDITATVTLATNLGSDSGTILVETSSDDVLFNRADDYLITDDSNDGGNDPTMVHVFSGKGAAIEPTAAALSRDNITYNFDVTVPAGGRVILMHLASQNSNRAMAAIRARELLNLRGSVLVGLSPDEQRDIVNFVAFPDTDEDGLNDPDEATSGTDPNNPDTDGDGLLDGFEVTQGFDPLVPGEGVLDSDGDGLDNIGEQTAGTNPFNADSDSDGLGDAEEINATGTDPLNADTDSGGRTDGQEVVEDSTDPLDSTDDLLSSGNMLVIEPQTQQVLRISPTGTVSVAITQADIRAATGFSGASLFSSGIVVDAGNSIYFTENTSGTVLKRTRGGPVNVLTTRAQLMAATGATSVSPRGLVLASDGFLYMVDSISDSVLQIDPVTGSVNLYVSKTQLSAVLGGVVALLDSIAADNQGTLYIASFNFPDTIFAVAPGGVPSVLSSGGVLSNLAGFMTTASNGDIIIADSGAGTIHRDSPSGTVSTFISRTDLSAVINGASPDLAGGIGFDLSGNFYVAETNLDHILRFDNGVAPGAVFVSSAQIQAVTGSRPDLRSGIAFVPPRDSDSDGLSDDEERVLGTDPANPDSDGDGLLDGFEQRNGFNPQMGGEAPLDPDADGLGNLAEQSAGTDPGNADSDSDGLSDGDEMTVFGTNPLRTDSDRDGLDDGDEVNNISSDPLNSDTDGDGLIDGLEVNLYGSSPIIVDSDGDGLNDGVEIDFNLDPTNPGDAAADFDNDGLTNAEEIALGTSHTVADTDGDGLTDGEEVNIYATDPLLEDTDGGGRSDSNEINVDGTDPLDPLDEVPFVNLPSNLFDSNGFLWDVQQSGSISNGSSDAYDGGHLLSIDNTGFVNFRQAVTEDNGREFRIGSQTINTLQVSRKAFVSDNEAFIRYLEILTNPTGSDINVTVRLNTNLGSDASTRLVATSNGDSVVTAADDYLITDDSTSEGVGDPAMVHVFSGPGASLEPSLVTLLSDRIVYEYAVTVPAGGRAIVMHFASQNSNTTVAQTSADALRTLQGAALDGLSAAERQAVVNFNTVPDSDADGLSDDREIVLGTDPLNPDTDNDGLLDGFEIDNGFNPLIAGEGLLDADGDGLNNLGEQLAGTDPASEDTDGDGLSDGEEVNTFATDPLRVDSDGGGRSDLLEVNVDSTDPLNRFDDALNSGDLYLLESTGSNVVRIDPAGQARIAISRNEILAATGFFSVSYVNRGIAVDAANNAYYFTEGTNDVVLKRSGDGMLSILASRAALLSATGNSSVDPVGIALGGDGFVYVNDSITDSVLRIDPDTGSVSVYVSAVALTALPEITAPSLFGGIVGDDQGNLYVASNGTPDALFIIQPDGTPSTLASGVPFGNPSRFIARAPSGDIIVSDTTGIIHRIALPGNVSTFLSQAQLRRVTGSSVSLDGGIAFDSSGHFYLADPNQDQILRFEQGSLAGSVFVTREMLQAAVSNFINLGAGLATVPLRDLDNDGFSDENEQLAGTDPNNPDTDGDGMLDGFEIDQGFDPLNPADAALDEDADGLTNLMEQGAGTDPRKADSDEDGVSDGDEVNVYGSDPLASDTDLDGLSDGEEVNVYATDPLIEDTDGDGIKDGAEVFVGGNPNDPLSTPTLALYGVAKSSSTSPGTLYQIDPLTGVATSVGTINLNRISAMVSVNGALFGTGEDPATGTTVLFKIDPATAAVSRLGNVGFNRISGMAFRSATQELFAFSQSSRALGVIDTGTGAFVVRANISANGCCGNGLAFSPDDSLYHATENFVDVLDPLSGVAGVSTSLIYAPPADNFPRINAMDYMPGSTTLFTSLNDGNEGRPENYLATLDTTTGVVSIIGSTVDGLDALAWVELPVDTDSDGLTDLEEVMRGTDPRNNDSDGDGLLDGFEVDNGLDPLDPVDGASDVDGDGLTNLEEQAAGTDPNNSDTDGDGLSDGDEVNVFGTSPTLTDSDNDTLNDSDELNVYGTDPLSADSDGDGTPDGVEISLGSDPLDPLSEPDLDLFGITNNRFGQSTLYRIDALTGAATLVGPTGFNGISAMDMSDSGVIYAAGYQPGSGESVLLTIDPLSGSGIEVGPTNIDIFELEETISGMSFRNSDDTLFAFIEGSNRLVTIDTATGQTIDVGGIDSGCCGHGLAFSVDDTLFHASEGPFDTLDQTTGLASLVANLLFTAQANNNPRINAMDFLQNTGVLYASLDDSNGGNPENYLATIDETTAAVTIVGPTVNKLDALAWVQVPRDSDGDFLSDADEIVSGTDPGNPDTDGDGLLDGFEVNNGFDPLTAGEENLDSDDDGLNNLQEQTARTDPNDYDTDGGGTDDGTEILLLGTDPFDPRDDFRGEGPPV